MRPVPTRRSLAAGQPFTPRSLASCIEPLERRWLLTALVLDVTDVNAYGDHSGSPHPAPASAAAAGDDYAALNWLVNTQAIGDIVGRSVRIWNGVTGSGAGTVAHTVSASDTAGGLYFPAGTYGVSLSLRLKVGQSYVGRSGKDSNDASNAIIISPSLFLNSAANTSFAFKLDDDEITVRSLQFRGPAIGGLDAPSGRSGVTITDNRFTGRFISGGNYPLSVVFTTPLSGDPSDPSSGIQYNDFNDLTGTASGGIELYSPRNIQISNNRFWNINQGIHTNCFDAESPNITIDGNIGQRIGTKLIECQGAGTQNLRVTNNKVSDFTNITDSTFGISVSIHREYGGAVISGNEISDVPSLTGGGLGVRIGIEAGGGRDMIVENNIVYGMVAAVTVDSTIGTIVRNNTLKYYTHPMALAHPEWHGCYVHNSTDYDLSGQTDYSPNLPVNRAWTVAFDRFVTGTAAADTFDVSSDGNITDVFGLSRGTIPTGGPLPGRAVVYGFEGDDTLRASPALVARVVLDGGAGAKTPLGDSILSGNDTLIAGAGAETLFGGDGNDTIRIDLSPAGSDGGGNGGSGGAFPAGGAAIDIDGGAGADTFGLLSTAGADAVSFNPADATITRLNGVTLAANVVRRVNVESVTFDGRGAGDGLAIADGVVVKLAADQDLATLSMSATATLDVDSHALAIRGGSGWSYSAVAARIRSGRNDGAWNGFGIISSAARLRPDHTTGLGALSGSDYSGAVFAGGPVAANDVLVLYTFNGDTDFSRTVNFDDYVNTDGGYNNHLSTWRNGDFDQNGVINFDDYVLIDLAFARQSTPLETV